MFYYNVGNDLDIFSLALKFDLVELDYTTLGKLKHL